MDLGMSELLVIGIVALVVIGPRDLPEMFRQLGRFTAKLRAMSREFSRAMEQAANEAGVKDVAKDLNAIANPKAMGLNAVKDAVDKFEKWDPIKNAAKPTVAPASGTIKGPVLPEGSIPPSPPAAAAPVPAPATGPALAPAAEPGSETQALYDRKAARKAILEESAAKLKALDAADAAAAAAPAKPARRKKAEPATAAPPAATPPAAKTPRKKKAAEQ
ncbi:hypothetical protein MASR2M74_31570 [Paracoccaceae bacterium]